jgi:hypothetical protein
MSAIRLIIEGPDFSGKSTIATLVVKELMYRGISAQTIDTCCGPKRVQDIVRLAQEIWHLPGSLKSFIFHLGYLVESVYLWLMVRNARLIGPSDNVVFIQQSSHLRVLAHDTIYGRRLQKAALSAVLSLLHPGINMGFYLECPLNIRIQRWRESDQHDPRDLRRFTDGLAEHTAISDELRAQALAAGFNVIYTSQVSASEAASFIVSQSLRAWLGSSLTNG